MKAQMSGQVDEKLGGRERKRRETLQRIADTGLQLFIERGFDATTLDAIAEASEISRRTFFSYFKSKEDVLLAWQSGIGEKIRTAILQQSPDRAPIDVVLSALLGLAAGYDAKEMILIERLLSSTEQLRASKDAKYVQQEQTVFEALCELWPQAKRRNGLRLVAMSSIGALRIAVDRWANDGGTRPIAKYIRDAFASLVEEARLAD